MSKPIVAIVGRPNVGKSTLFNQIGKRRVSIVDDMPGVTRDRIYMEAEWLNHNFTMIDTGGIEPYSTDVILSQMRTQAEIAIETADVIILVTDLKCGVVASDIEISSFNSHSRTDNTVFFNAIVYSAFSTQACGINKIKFTEFIFNYIRYFTY